MEIMKKCATIMWAKSMTLAENCTLIFIVLFFSSIFDRNKAHRAERVEQKKETRAIFGVFFFLLSFHRRSFRCCRMRLRHLFLLFVHVWIPPIHFHLRILYERISSLSFSFLYTLFYDYFFIVARTNSSVVRHHHYSRYYFIFRPFFFFLLVFIVRSSVVANTLWFLSSWFVPSVRHNQNARNEFIFGSYFFFYFGLCWIHFFRIRCWTNEWEHFIRAHSY